jgi:hypothetical protein
MRTKTLLLTAALSAAGVASSLAQVYSVNAVGYVNTTLVPGFNLISNPLNNTEANGNTIRSLFGGLPEGSQIYKFTGTKFDIATRDDLSGSGFDSDAVANQTVVPGQGVFVRLNPGANQTVTFVGEVPQGNLSLSIPGGFSIISSQVPQAGNIDTQLGFDPAGGDQLYFWTEATQRYLIRTYDADFAEWDGVLPNLDVGEALFIRKNAPGTWNRTFNVNG